MLNFDSMTVARAAVGWKLKHGKGDFRLMFDGIAEDGYTFSARGRALQAIIEGTGTVAEGLDWWQIDIADGVMHGRRDAPRWDQTVSDDPANGGNGDGMVQQNEVTYLGDVPENEFYLDYMRPTAADLENRLQTVDLLYGRTWGGRRFSGRWWAGLRYFVYDGNVRAGAWLNTSQPGEGFTDGPLLRLLNFRQESTGLGPTGTMEANFNFFQKKVVLYLQASASFLLVDITADSGLFFTTLNTPTQPFLIVPIEARLQSERDKSTWQTAAEVGARWNIGGSGVELEAAYYIRGYLDAVLLPSTIQIPTTLGQAGQGTSAVYNTHDIRIDGWRFGVGFQF